MDEQFVVKSKDYYFHLIQEIDEITKPKDESHLHKLPPSSIWNTMKLATATEAKKRMASNIVFDIERDKLRIHAAVACEVKKSGRAPTRQLHDRPVVLTPRERGIEDDLLQQYRNDPKRYKALMDRVQHKTDTRQKAHQDLKEELGARTASKKESALSVEQRLAVAQQRRSTIAQEHQQLLTELGEARAARQSAKLTSAAPIAESSESRYLRGVAWLKVVAVASRVECLREVLVQTRALKAQDVMAWNATARIQRAWKAFFFQKMLREAVSAAQTGVGFSTAEADFGSSVGSMRLRRAVRSEKLSGPSGSASVTAVLQAPLEVPKKSLFTVRAEAAAQITTFLRDINKLFRNVLLKYVRMVKRIQGKFKIHFAVNVARANMMAMWFERHLPALLLHVRIVAAGRGLDLKNLTTHDREHIRQAQEHFLREYRYQPPPAPPRPPALSAQPADLIDAHAPVLPSAMAAGSDGEFGASTTAAKKTSATASEWASVKYKKLDSSLLREMNTVAFHAFLRSHLDQIAGSDFHVYHIAGAGGMVQGGGSTSGTQANIAQNRHFAENRRAVKHSMVMNLLFKKRREYVLRTSKRAEVVYDKLEASLDDARSFLKCAVGEDPVTVHLKGLRLKEEVEREVRRNRKLGSKGWSRTTMMAPVLSAELPPQQLLPAPTSSPARSVANAGSDSFGSASRSTKSQAGPASPVQGLNRGGSSKGPAISFGKDSSSFKGSAHGGLGRGDSFKSVAPALNRGDSFKRSAGKSQKGSRTIEPDSVADSVPLLLPPPDIFLLLRSVNAQEMALLYLDIADKLRRDYLIEKMRRRKPSAFAGASFGHSGSHSRERDPQYAPLFATAQHGSAVHSAADHEPTPAPGAIPHRPSSTVAHSSFPPSHRKQSSYTAAATAGHGPPHGTRPQHGGGAHAMR